MNAKAEPYDPKTAWAYVWAMLCTIVQVFGHPVDILERVMIRRTWRREVLAMLRPLEQIARRMLHIEALKCVLPPLRPRARRTPVRIAAQLPSNRKPFVIREPEPVEARVAGRAAVDSRRNAPRDPDFEFVPAHPLASRIDALARLVENPAAAIRRVARALHARRVSRVYLRPVTLAAYHPEHRAFLEPLLEELGRAEHAWQTLRERFTHPHNSS